MLPFSAALVAALLWQTANPRLKEHTSAECCVGPGRRLLLQKWASAAATHCACHPADIRWHAISWAIGGADEAPAC